MTTFKKQIDQKQKDISKTIGEKYDQIPYASYPFEYNRPENLRTIGVLFGMNPPKLEAARVLELGSAEGGNLIRFAETYPKSYTLGVDLSGVEIARGQEHIKELGLKNIELKNMSITDLDESYGKFDYIICHGVYSWVPEFVREKILEVSSKLLSKDGIAFVSYNTLPGWNMIGTVRELMLYHASNFTTEAERINQAKLALGFLKDSLDGAETPHAKFMSSAANMMADKEDNYIRHEYLAEENKAFYFHEFIEDARAQGLEYLGDSDLHRMYVGNLPASAAEKLGVINDIVKTEQYIDFIKNTQFRCTLMCHKETNLSRNITFEMVKELLITSVIVPQQPESAEVLKNSETIKFNVNNSEDIFVSVSSPALKTVMYVLAENINNPLSIDEIIKLARKKNPDVSVAQMEAELAGNAARLIFSGYFKIYADKPLSKYEISNKPKISDFARFQVSKCPPNGRLWITNHVNSVLNFAEHQRHILSLLDGKHTVDEVKKDIYSKMQSGIIVASRDDKKIEDEKELKEVAGGFVDGVLGYLRLNYGLVG